MSNNKDFKVKNGIQPTVYHEAVGTVVSGTEGYYLSGASYDSVSFSVSSQDLTPHDVFFKPDGIKMYIVGFEDQDINEYNLSTAWDISTASFSQSFSVAAQESSPKSIFFKEGGLKVYLVGYTGDAVYEYNLSTAWDISTASFSQSFSVASQDTSPLGLIFKPDGSKMYIVGNVNDSVYEYNLSTAWDISTASFLQSFSVNAQDTAPYGLSFKPDGTKMYVIGAVGQDINEYRLSTAWDISTAVFSFTLSVASQDTGPRGLFFKPEGLKMYVIGSATRKVYQYSTALSTAEIDLSTGSVFDYTPTSDVQVTLTNPATSGTSSGATLLLGSEDSTGVGSTFSTTLYTGTNAAQTITNGLDLASDGGMLWFKNRGLAEDPMIVDTVRGGSADIYPNEANAVDTDGSIASFNSDGFTFINTSGARQNVSGYNYVSWAFKEQAKFFDIVTWTGNGTHPRTLSHNLNSSIGFMATKETNAVGNWTSFHRGLTNGFGTGRLYLNATNSIQNESLEFLTSTNSSFTFTSDTGLNSNGVNYVAYLFAHDTDASSIIKCGSYTGNSTVGHVINLGFEAQWVLVKNTSDTESWIIYDVIRGMPASGNGARIRANDNGIEESQPRIGANSQGFQLNSGDGECNISNNNYIYMAIRGPSIPTITYDPDLQWSGGTAPTAPAAGETDVITFNTTDGGTTYKSALAVDGAK